MWGLSFVNQTKEKPYPLSYVYTHKGGHPTRKATTKQKVLRGITLRPLSERTTRMVINQRSEDNNSLLHMKRTTFLVHGTHHGTCPFSVHQTIKRLEAYSFFVTAC